MGKWYIRLPVTIHLASVLTTRNTVFLHPLILFSAHPLLNSTAVLLLVQAILILQPTHTAPQKKRGTLAHFAFNSISINLLLAGLVIIEYNKFAHKGTHFVSPHAILGLITYILIFSQSVIGSTAYFVPKIYGSEDKAKSLYKWHRLSGYLILVMLLATVAAATQTDYSKNVLHIRLWSTLVASVLILVGVVPRIKKGKFGFGNRRVLQSGAFGQ